MSNVRDRFQPLFDPRGLVVAGVSRHPGKFGFMALHNILRNNYRGAVYATSRSGEEVLGVRTLPSATELPEGAVDLVVVCTPTSANLELLKVCAAKGARAALVTSAGYGESGPEGEAAERDLVALSRELGMVLAGPNGQGLVSTTSSLCAQILGPYPPTGQIGIVSQSGNIVSAFMNYSLRAGIGISRALSAGNAAATSVTDVLEFFAEDPATTVALAYVEGIGDGRSFFERVSRVAARKPVVLLKGGQTPGGQRAAASHTGSLATDARIFDGACRQAGVTLATTVDEAFEAAATFATQPLPRGPRTAVITTAGGWGVVTADALDSSGLTLMPLPNDLQSALDAKMPPRWSRSNPIDLAGGETKDTIPDALELVAGHEDVDAVIFLGLGIQSNQAELMKTGRFYPGSGIDRIVAYHERQDSRFAELAAAISASSGKPVLTATELSVTAPDNPGPATVRTTGRLCYATANRAVTALDHLWQRARWRNSRL